VHQFTLRNGNAGTPITLPSPRSKASSGRG